MNVTITRSPDISIIKVYQAILDCIDGKGKTIIITRDQETECRWRIEMTSFMRSKNHTNNNFVDLSPVFVNFYFLRIVGTNFDEVQILNYHGYKNIVLDNVWSVYYSTKTSEWVNSIKEANPEANFIGISDTLGKSYMQSMRRITDIKHVNLEDFKNMFLEIKKDDLPPSKTIHVCIHDISDEGQIESASYSPNGKTMEDKRYVNSDTFMQEIEKGDGFEIRAYCRTPIAIDLLSKATRSLSTAMTFFPTPIYGRKLTYVASQLNDLFMKMDLKGLSKPNLSRDWQIDIRSQKSLIFCDSGHDDGLRKYVNWYAKPGFKDATVDYAVNGFMKDGFSVLCIEGRRIGVNQKLLSECKNIFLFGSNKYDKGLIKNIINNATDDINIVVFASKDTIDESNVLKVIDDLKDNSLTVLKHDLSS